MRISRKLLESRVKRINNLLGLKDGDEYLVTLDHHQPGGNTHTWQVIVGQRRNMENGRWYYLEVQPCGTSGRMTTAECLERLEGIIWGLSAFSPLAAAEGIRPWFMNLVIRQ